MLGYLVRGPLGGLAWHHLQYVAGLIRQGHDVCFMEDSDDFPSCYDPTTHQTGSDPSYGLRFTGDAFHRLGMPDNWCYFDATRNRWLGPAGSHALEICASADLLLNVSAVNQIRPWLATIPNRVVIDTDPAFTQIRGLNEPGFRQLLDAHNVFFTFGENYGLPDCGIPLDGRRWRPTRQPILLEAWKVSPGRPAGAFTTVMQWDSYKSRDFGGRHFGMKSESFLPFMCIPSRTGESLEIAMGSESAPRSDLTIAGWHLTDPLTVTRDPWTYQAYLSKSKAEFSVAKQGYVSSRSGWFSERSAAYLASGRPVVVQDTGFSAHIPIGRGIMGFRTADEAIDAIADVSSNYDRHSSAAREIAEQYFDSDLVLRKLLDQTFSEVP